MAFSVSPCSVNGTGSFYKILECEIERHLSAFNWGQYTRILHERLQGTQDVDDLFTFVYYFSLQYIKGMMHEKPIFSCLSSLDITRLSERIQLEAIRTYVKLYISPAAALERIAQDL